MTFEAAAALTFVVTGALDFAGVISLSRYGTHLVVPVGTRHLALRFGDALESGSLPGFRVVALGKDRYLLRPVLWFEREPSAAPLLVTVAVATVDSTSVTVRIYAPLGALLLAALLPTCFLGPPISRFSVTGIILAGALILAWTIRMYRSEFGTCFDRLERAWATAPENNKMQLTRSAHLGGSPRS
jgi:hypothetical protein